MSTATGFGRPPSATLRKGANVNKLLSTALGLTLLALLCGSMSGAQQATSDDTPGIVVSPIRLFLASDETSGDVTIANRTDEFMRFQVTGFAWSQTLDGQAQLTPSNDLIFYPTIFALASGASQVIRVGVIGNPPTTERTFRIVVTSLPAPQLPGEAPRLTDISLSEAYSVPIFVQPANPFSRLEVSNVTLDARKLAINLRNIGTSYDMVHGVTATGLSATGATVFTAKTGGWYVLAHSDRLLTVTIPKGACASVRSVKIVTASENGEIEATLPVQGTCPE